MALFGIAVLYIVSALNETVVAFVGLRGGPLEEHRRRAVRPLSYIEVCLWVAILSFTCYGTYIAESPSIAETCWSSNPCEYSQEVIQAMCTDNASLTPSCLSLWTSGDKFNYCSDKWMDYGATALVTYYDHSEPNPEFGQENETELTPYFKPVDIATYQCNDTYGFHSKEIQQFIKMAFSPSAQTGVIDEESQGQESLPLEYESALLKLLNIPYTNETAGSDAPWFKCFDSTCQQLIQDGDNCSDWRTLVSIPSSDNRKEAFLGAVFSSWAILIIQGLVVYFAFNAWPDYENEEAWEGAVKKFGSMFCCMQTLEGAETEAGQPAAKEIGNLLHILFGAIDLDPSDQFLGMYLVSERQQWRRHQHALTALKKAGIVPSPPPKSCLIHALWLHIRRPFTAARDWYHSRSDVELKAMGSCESPMPGLSFNDSNDHSLPSDATITSVSGIEQPQAVPENDSVYSNPRKATTDTTCHPLDLFPNTDVAVRRNYADDTDRASLWSSSTAIGAGSSAMSSIESPSGVGRGVELEFKTATTSTTSKKAKTTKQGIAYTPPEIPHSFVRLMSVQPSAVPSKQLTLSIDGGSKDSTVGGWSIAAPIAGKTWRFNPFRRNKHSREQQSSSVLPPSDSKQVVSGSSALSPALLKKKLAVETKSRPLVSPVSLDTVLNRLPITAYTAARIYGMESKPVEKKDLEEAYQVCNFAKAAYGLQTIKWAYASNEQGCMASTWDSALSCAFCAPCRGPLGLDSHFRKRNFKAILDLTEIEPADFLYVSYTNAAFGVLPYMVLLHRATRSVVVSIRGSVGFEDLITDLLSNPIDAADSMPQWVKNELGEDAEMFAHAGINSSAKAILRDLEEKGLLGAMMRTTASGQQSNNSTASSTNGGQTHQNGSPTVGTYAASPNMSQTAAFVRQGSRIADRSASNNKILHKLGTLDDDDVVDLDLSRAQVVVDEALNNQDWNVVVTGHSLGAAVACMISFELRQYFPRLRCFAFCSPGGLLSANLAEISEQFCISIMVGCDAITRLSFSNTQRVVDEMVLALARCKRPKLAILLDVLVGRRKDLDKAPPTFCSFEDVGPEAQAVLKKYVATSKLHDVGADAQELYPPGRILHLRPFSAHQPKKAASATMAKKMMKSRAKPGDDVWDAVWTTKEKINGEGMLLNLSMTKHHRVQTLEEAFVSAIAGEAQESGKNDELLPPGEDAV